LWLSRRLCLELLRRRGVLRHCLHGLMFVLQPSELRGVVPSGRFWAAGCRSKLRPLLFVRRRFMFDGLHHGLRLHDGELLRVLGLPAEGGSGSVVLGRQPVPLGVLRRRCVLHLVLH
jgi:hypothetical protein